MIEDTTRELFADPTEVAHADRAGVCDAAHTALEIRSMHGTVDTELYAWIRERMGRSLGRFASQIERIVVRFGDENGPKGGVDQLCLVQLVLSNLPPIAVEMRGGTEREAFDLAAGRAMRAFKHAMERHDYHVKPNGH